MDAPFVPDHSSARAENNGDPDGDGEGESFETPFGTVRVVRHAAQLDPGAWTAAFGGTAKDFRYYELCEKTLQQPNFDYRYLLLTDRDGRVRALQPLFFTDQDLTAGLGTGPRRWAASVRRRFPRFATMKMLMVGCTAGEGHLGVADPADAGAVAGLLEALEIYGRKHRTAIITFKDFPRQHRAALDGPARRRGFVRMPSFPATVIPLHEYKDFDDYLSRRLSHGMRKNLRRKFRSNADRPPVTMEVRSDVSDIVDEVHPLYLQVLARSDFRFEELTKEYLAGLGRTLPGQTRFFVWRQDGKAVAFSIASVHDGKFYDNYLGLDYAVALDLHLYFVTIRDLMTWAMSQGLRTYYSTPLNYDPKLHLRFDLEPLDLYVRHLSALANPFFKRIAPLLEPTRHDKLLRRFGNYSDLA